jgi:salicylate hydroxylase
MNVLQLVGVAEKLMAESPSITNYHDTTATDKVLGDSDLPKSFKDKYHQPLMGIKRTTINMMLKNSLHDLEVDVREGWELLNIKEEEDSVTAYFNEGRSVTGSFLIGCDGIKSATRESLLRMHGIKEEPPSYTGLTQVSNSAHLCIY